MRVGYAVIAHCKGRGNTFLTLVGLFVKDVVAEVGTTRHTLVSVFNYQSIKHYLYRLLLKYPVVHCTQSFSEPLLHVAHVEWHSI